MNQTEYGVLTTKDSLPRSSSGTGTIDIPAGKLKILGTGTLFSTEMPAGSYIVDLTNDEVRRVDRMDTDTVAVLEAPFTNAQSGAYVIIPRIETKVKEISLTTSDLIYLNGEQFTGIVTFSKTGNDRSMRPDLIDPIIVDATGGSVQYEIMRY